MPLDLPRRLVLVRHAESEGNAANGGVAMPDEFWLRHVAHHDLTGRGVEQAMRCGELLRELGLDRHDAYLVSPMRRALLTAGHLGLSHARWQVAPWLAERAWGADLRTVDAARRATVLADAEARSAEDPWFWAPPGGEPIAGAASRALLGLLVWAGTGGCGSVVAVTHGEVVRGLRSLLLPGLAVDAADNALGNAQFAAVDCGPGGRRRVLTSASREWSDWVPVAMTNAELIRFATADTRGNDWHEGSPSDPRGPARPDDVERDAAYPGRP